ncbi:MAG TPA: hypothetical protein VK395_11945 [Gemmataceae bacterium]|nr:hypothetical protein [Gemmataceae bacterium]
MSNSLDLPELPAGTTEPAIDLLRGRPNPFESLVRPQRSDDRFADLHVQALLQAPRELLLRVIDAYRVSAYQSASDLRDTRIVTILGDRGSGKTHMLESLGHRTGERSQILIRPTYYATQVPFEEYLLSHLVNALLESDHVHGGKLFEDIAAHLIRRMLQQALRTLGPTDRLFASDLSRWERARLLWGRGEPWSAKFDHLIQDLADKSCKKDLLTLAGHYRFSSDLLMRLLVGHLHRHEAGDDAVRIIRRHLYVAMARNALLKDDDALSRFLEADYTLPNNRPLFRADVVKHLLHALIEICALVRLPVVFAFDNLEGFLAPQSQFDAAATNAFMDSLAQAVDSTRGLLFLIFAESTLFRQVTKQTNQFALDRIRQGVPLHAQGPVDLIELKPPSCEELQQLIRERVGRLLKDFAGSASLPAGYPYTPAFLNGLAQKTGMGLRNRLLLLRDEYSRVVYGRGIEQPVVVEQPDATALLERTWTESLSAADRKLQGALVNQLQALHAGLGGLLQQLARESFEGWQPVSVQATVAVGDHPVYGLVTLVDWQKKPTNGNAGTVRGAIGFLVSKGAGMPRDLKAKFELFRDKTLRVDHLTVLWPRAVEEGDLAAALPEATRQIWTSSRRRRQAVLRSLSNDELRKILAYAEWMEVVRAAAEQPIEEEALRSFIRQRCQAIVQLALPPVPERTTTDGD